MRLDQALVHRKLCDSRKEAQELIENSFVLVDGIVSKKQTKEITDKMFLEVTQRRQFVSRGGDKLENVLLDVYGSKEGIAGHLTGLTALDAGSSTGGFTDCLLQYQVESVTAVDVGSRQFHTKLQNDPKVTLYENTDIRSFKTERLYDFITADLSFISLEKVLSVIFSFGTDEAEYFLLIKPQFEVGKGNTKKGIVKDVLLVESIIKNYVALTSAAIPNALIKVFPCRIVGGDGNQEYFLYVKRII